MAKTLIIIKDGPFWTIDGHHITYDNKSIRAHFQKNVLPDHALLPDSETLIPEPFTYDIVVGNDRIVAKIRFKAEEEILERESFEEEVETIEDAANNLIQSLKDKNFGTWTKKLIRTVFSEGAKSEASESYHYSETFLPRFRNQLGPVACLVGLLGTEDIQISIKDPKMKEIFDEELEKCKKFLENIRKNP